MILHFSIFAPFIIFLHALNILVCISHVPETTSKINFSSDHRVFEKNGVQFIINPKDELALSKALLLKEAAGSGTVTVIHVGKEDTEQTLRKALAIGADKAIRINADPKNGLFVARQIAGIINDNEYHLILMGTESIDYNGGGTPGALAALLNYPFINHCIGLEISETLATAIRDTETGEETVRAQLPLLAAVQKGIVKDAEVKIPNMRGIMAARQKPLQTLEPSDIPSRLDYVSFEKPLPKATTKFINPEEIDQLADIFRNELKII